VTNGAFRLHPVEWNIGEAAGALAAHCLDRKLSPREVRGKASHLEDFQRTLMKMGIELRWSRLEVARSYNSHYAEVPGWYFGEAERKYGK
jgi:predicted nucleic acid-binding protein